MVALFLIFLGIGGANSILGGAWPAISAEIGTPISRQSILILIVYLSGALGAVTARSVFSRLRTWIPATSGIIVIAIAIFVFSGAPGFVSMPFSCAALGYFIGMEAALINSYVTKHYTATAMSWLHCSFAVGCALGPAILSYFITNMDSWRMGYQANGFLEVGIFVVLLVSFPLWRVHGPVLPSRLPAGPDAQATGSDVKAKSNLKLLRIPEGAVIPIILLFFCSYESTFFSWATSFLTEERGMLPGAAAGMLALFFGGQVAGRIASGFISLRVSDRILIRVSMIVVFAATIIFIFAPDNMMTPIFIVIGVATGPIFPMLIHEVPSLVGEENAQGVIGLQLGGANIGNASIPLLAGEIAGVSGFRIFPVFLIVLIGIALALKTAQDIRVAKARRV